MELDLAELNPEIHDAVEPREVGLASPMGGKHQRNLSLSAKWASNKALALEYLKRQREVVLWIEGVLCQKLPTHDLYEALKSGIVLRELLLKLYPEPSECLSPISRKYSQRMAPWKERENISVFLKQCKALGMNDLFLFCTDDLYEGNNMVQVLFAVQHFMAFSEENSRFWIKPAVHEHVTFSNQELELAMSKIEKAGVDANVLLTSAPPSATPSPLKPTTEDVDLDTGAADEIRMPHETDEEFKAAEREALEKELQGDCYVIGETGNNDDGSDTERSSHGPEEPTPDDGEEVGAAGMADLPGDSEQEPLVENIEGELVDVSTEDTVEIVEADTPSMEITNDVEVTTDSIAAAQDIDIAMPT
ncbi:hypothetical protein P43SY_002812 [Pythium insidiosum]|uniref:Calponin-homology (CH) domain-containing protein n=1 Tax=Pythium insidiosum TaxID=114742 RepID=A0AAD5LQ57_PYTIN|nr:hypothetical protein P43SY_002812 [Pythium insidiosum]